jgi:hypothetical protein
MTLIILDDTDTAVQNLAGKTGLQWKLPRPEDIAA